MAGIHGVASFPGVIAIEGATYTASHSVSPGVAVLRCSPQPEPPAAFGDLVIADGNESVIVPGCRLESMTVERDDRGFFWSLAISDRRWRWGQHGVLNGCYNQLDPHGKLIPWTIRSPTELAVLCLEAMGETGYSLNLPAGLAYPGPFIGIPLVNTTGTNPPVNWDGVPPAQALQQVAELFGCRVIYQHSTDSVLVGPPGNGASFPPGSIASRGPSLKTFQAPDAVGVIGSPTRYQMRLALQAVGKEWDGSYWPINQLSYAPLSPGSPGAAQKNTISPINPQAGVTYKVTVTPPPPKPGVDPRPITVSFTCTTNVVLDACNGIRAAMNANPGIAALCGSFSTGTSVIAGGKQVGVVYDVEADVSPPILSPPQSIEVSLTTVAQPAQVGTADWSLSAPPTFANVRATNRLTLAEARALAQESVFRCYAPTGVDVSGKGPIVVPGFGPVQMKQQLILQSTQVDQVVPQPLNPDLADRTGQAVAVNFYNGYSRDKPAAVYGSVSRAVATDFGSLHFVDPANPNDDGNTPAGRQVFVSFTISDTPDGGYGGSFGQVLTFSVPVYAVAAPTMAGGGIAEPNLTLQAAVLVRDPDTNQIVSFTKVLPLAQAAGTAPLMKHYPDIQLEVTTTYDNFNRLLATSILDADAIRRANLYLASLAIQYRLDSGETREYNGVKAVNLDGLTQQITWSVGPGGASTTVSQNTEHSIYVPPYPARRRAEFLAAFQRQEEAPKRIDLGGR